MTSRVLFLLGAAFLGGCGGGIQLKAIDPSSFQVPSDLKTSLDQVFSTDSTFAPKPQDWIGRVGVVRKVKNPDTGNLVCSNKGTVGWVVDRVGSPSTLLLNDLDTTKRLIFKSVVDLKFALKLDVMKFVSQDMDANTVFKVLMTEVAKQRVNPNDAWTSAIKKFQTEKNADYFTPDDICYVVTVAGYTYRLLTREKFIKMTGKTAVSYAGINVNGDYFNTSEEFALDDVFGLSLEILRRPPSMGGGDTGIVKTDDGRKLTPDDSGFLRSAFPQKPAPFTKSTTP